MGKPTAQPVRVLIADSQRLVSEALAVALGRLRGFSVLGERPSMGLDAAEAVIKTKPNVALLDHWLPVVDGPTATGIITARAPGTKVIVLSWLFRPSHVEDCLNAGAAGFLPKSVDLGDLETAIRRVHAGEALVYAQELMNLVANISRRQHDSEQRRALIAKLTPKDLRTLWLLSSGQSMKDVGRALSLTPGSLQMRIHNILKKTGARSQIEAIALVREQRIIPPSYPT